MTNRERSPEVSVLSSGGACFVLDSVLKISIKAEQALRVHIIPGQIEWNGKITKRFATAD